MNRLVGFGAAVVLSFGCATAATDPFAGGAGGQKGGDGAGGSGGSATVSASSTSTSSSTTTGAGGAMCGGEFVDCDGDGSCDTHLSQDLLNCGSCKHACPGAVHAAPACVKS